MEKSSERGGEGLAPPSSCRSLDPLSALTPSRQWVGPDSLLELPGLHWLTVLTRDGVCLL